MRRETGTLAVQVTFTEVTEKFDELWARAIGTFLCTTRDDLIQSLDGLDGYPHTRASN